MQPAPRGRQDQFDGGPVLSRLLCDLGKIGDGQPLAVERQVIQRSPGSAGHVVGKLHLGADQRCWLQGSLTPRRTRQNGRLVFCVGQALLRQHRVPGGRRAWRALISRRLPDCARGVSGQMTGHLGEVVVAGAAETQRPRQCRGGRLGQVAQKAQTRLFGGVLIVKRLNGVAASFDLRTQLRGFLAERIGAVATVHLNVQQNQIPSMGRDPNRGRIHRCGQVADHYGPARLHAHRAAALHARAVLEDGHGRDRCVEASALRHPALLSARVRSTVPNLSLPVFVHRFPSR